MPLFGDFGKGIGKLFNAGTEMVTSTAGIATDIMSPSNEEDVVAKQKADLLAKQKLAEDMKKNSSLAASAYGSGISGGSSGSNSFGFIGAQQPQTTKRSILGSF